MHTHTVTGETMITMETNKFLIAAINDSLNYEHDGIACAVDRAYHEVLNHKNREPLIDDVVALYQEMIEREFEDDLSDVFEDEVRWDFRCDLLADSVDFVIEYCAKNNLAAQKRIYKTPEYTVKDICRVITAQVPLFYFYEEQFVCLHSDENTRVITLFEENGQASTIGYTQMMEVEELCIC